MSNITTVRASSWSKLFDCPHKFEWENLLDHYKPAGMRALLGTAIHAGTSAFDQGRIDQSGITPDDAAGAVVDTIHHPEFEVDRSQDDLTEREAERIGLTLHARYCLDVSPKYQFRSVEMETKPMDIDCGNGVIVRLTGTMDRSRVRQSDDGKRVGVTDLKSGAAAVVKGVAKTKGHVAQVGTYEMLLEHTTGETITDYGEIIGLKTKGKLEIATGTIKNAKEAMIGTETQKGMIEYAAAMFSSGLFPPNPSSMLCSEKYCARWQTCLFRAR